MFEGICCVLKIDTVRSLENYGLILVIKVFQERKTDSSLQQNYPKFHNCQDTLNFQNNLGFLLAC